MSASQESNIISGIRICNYPQITLGEVADYINGKAFKPQEWSNSGLPIIRIQNLTSVEAPYNYYDGEIEEQYRVSKGDLLISWSASLDAFMWDGGNAVLNQHIFRVEENSKLIRRKYLFYAVKSVIEEMREKVHGATMCHIVKPEFEATRIPLPPILEQDKIIEALDRQLGTVEHMRKSIEEQIQIANLLPFSLIQKSMKKNDIRRVALSECLTEVNQGNGGLWKSLPLLGVSRRGLTPAKETIGKHPERYKILKKGTIFYNPMRILIGSIAVVDDGDPIGITSPDYVAFTTNEGVLDYRWFYQWLRSPFGETYIKQLARGAVRERMLFNRLIQGTIEIPDYKTQMQISEDMALVKNIGQRLEEQLAFISSLPKTILRNYFSAG